MVRDPASAGEPSKIAYTKVDATMSHPNVGKLLDEILVKPIAEYKQQEAVEMEKERRGEDVTVSDMALPVLGSDVVKAYAGSGKSVAAAVAATHLWMEHRAPVLYVTLKTANDEDFEAFQDRLRKGLRDAEWPENRIEDAVEQWVHWKGHALRCPTRTLATLGDSGGQCNCDPRPAEHDAEWPAFAALEYILRAVSARLGVC